MSEEVLEGPRTSAAAPVPDSLVTQVSRRLLPLLFVVVTLGALARLAANPLGNPDTYFHLRIGHEFLSGHWSVRHPGHFSALETNDWAPTQWLSQIVMAAVENVGGLSAVAWLQGLLFIVLACTHFFVARQQSSLLVAAVLTPIAVLASASGLSMRPQVVSYILTGITVATWMHCRRTGRIPWTLVPLTWFWALCHGMWPVGIVLSATAALGIALDTRPDRRRLLLMFTVPVLSAVAAGLTPVGPRLYQAVMLVNSRGEYFTEWAPPDFTDWNCLCLLALIGLAVVALLRAPGRAPWLDVFLLGTAVAFGVYSGRTVPVAAAVAVPLTARALQQHVSARNPPSRAEGLTIVAGAALALAGLAIAVPHSASHPGGVPAWVDGKLGAMPAGTRVLSDMGSGGYLLWRFPRLDVAVHGYADVYTDHELHERKVLTNLDPGWDKVLQELHPKFALLPSDSRLSYALVTTKSWTVLAGKRGPDEYELLMAPGSPTT